MIAIAMLQQLASSRPLNVWGYTLPMRIACCALAVVICSSLSGQTSATFDLVGGLELVDRPSDSTPVEAMLVTLHPLENGYDIQARPDNVGRFVLKKVRPGRYFLQLPFPGRIQTFTNGSQALAPDGFELSSSDSGPIRIVVSLKTSVLSVRTVGVSGKNNSVVVLLAPADPYLTLRESCISNALIGPQSTFQFVPPGKYRIFVIDSKLQSDIAAYAPKFPDFLKDRSTLVEISEGSMKATATYVDPETIKQAVQKLGLSH
jgi:hypothetical protein